MTATVETIPRPPPVATPASRRRALRRVLRNPLSAAGLVVVVLVLVAAALADLLAPYSPTLTDFDATLQPPSLAHWFGTEIGRASQPPRATASRPPARPSDRHVNHRVRAATACRAYRG